MASVARLDAAGFEAAVQQLEQTVADLESGGLGLDLALAKYQVGVQLLTQCYGLLDGAERMVALLRGVDGDGNPLTEPFDATATADRESARDADAGKAVPPGPRRAVAATDDDSPPF